MNIVETIQNQLGAGLSNKLAGMLGVEPDAAKSATSAAIPALLAGLTGVASTPDGARRLDAVVDSVDDNVAQNPLSALSGGRSAIDQGAGMLQSLLGNNMLSGLGGALSKFTGMGGGSITSILGALAPMVLGLLKGQKQSLGLSGGGLASLLMSQKQNIMGALPSGLTSMMSGIPGLSALTGLGDTARSAASSVASGAQTAYGEARDAGRSAMATASSAAATATPTWKWVVPVLALLALGLLLWRLLSGGPDNTTAQNQPALPRTVQPAPPVAQTPAPTMTDAAQLAGAKVGDSVTTATTQLKDVFKSITDSMTSITDPASADSAVTKLQDASTKLDGVRKITDTLPDDARSSIATMVRDYRSTFTGAADKVMAIPGVGDKIRPIYDAILKKLDAIAGTSTP